MSLSLVGPAWLAPFERFGFRRRSTLEQQRGSVGVEAEGVGFIGFRRMKIFRSSELFALSLL